MAYYDNSADGALIYAIKGGKTNEFWAYDPAETTWTKRSDVTAGTKAVGKGAAMTAGAGFVYVMKGNGGRDFYKYNATDTSWTKAKDIPWALDQTATRGKGVKAGGSLAYVHVRDSDYVYVLKGYGTDFYRYDVARDTHFSLVAAPYTSKPKYDKGSWICYDGTQYIYVMQAKYNALYRYDVTTEAWDAASTLKGMPFNSTVTGKTNKKVGDGSAAAWDGQAIFAPKGGGTQEVWKYTPGTDGDTWAELESIPQAYAAGAKKKKVKSGGAIAYYPVTGVFYIQKGNKSNQFWMYTPATGPVCGQRQNRDGVTGAGATNVATSIAVCPNPLANGCATVRYSLPKAGTVTLSVHDVTGRMVMLRTLSVNRTGAAGLDLRGLSAGVYLVKLSADDGHTASQKLVVER
jgi:hypothetical protein